MDIIAEQRLVATFPDSEAVTVCLRVGRPRPHTQLDWVCPVEGEGLRLWQGPSELFGVGSWHALMIGIRFLREMIAAEVRQGALFHWEGSKTIFTLEEMFVLGEME